MTLRRLLSIGAVCAGFATAVLPIQGCGSQEPLEKVTELTDVHSGYADLGIVNGETRLVPSATVRIKNTGPSSISGFQLSAAFWIAGEDGEKDDLQIPRLVAKDLAPGAISDPILIRAKFGFKLEGARSDFFAHSRFADFTIKVFGKVGGRIVKIGEVNVERKILLKDGAVPIK